MTETYWVRNEYLCQGDKGRRTLVTDVVLQADHAQLVALVKALPVVDGEMELFSVKAGDCAVVVKKNGILLATFNSRTEAKAYMALLQARKELGS